MALNVKLPFGKSGGKLYQCSSCNFSTRYGPLYNMHSVRCTKMKCGPNQGQSIPRNYSCSLCEYKTNQSRLFLVHQVQAHKANNPIYPCEYCGYATRYRNKLVRHHANIHAECGELLENDILPLGPPIEMEHVEADLIAKGFWIEVDEELQKQADNSSKVKSTVIVRSPVPVNKKAASTSGGSKSSTAQYIYEGKSEITGLIEFRCKLCTYKSPNKWSAMKHVRNMHINGKLYCCEKCNFSTEKKIEFSIHKAKHSNQRMFNCNECEYETNQKSNLDRHQSNHTGKGPRKCDLCSYSSTGSPAILRHMQEHHRGAILPDSLLESAAMETQEANENVEDDMLEKDMMDYDVYKKINDTEGDEPMEDGSGEDNVSIDSLPPEEDSVMEETEDQGGEKVVHHSMECPLCHLQLPNESQLRSHIIVHPKFQPWICPECKSRYRRSSDLSRHLKKKHSRHIREYPRQELIVITLNSPTSGGEQNQTLSMGTEEQPFKSPTENAEQPLDLSYRDEMDADDVRKALFQTDFHKCKYCSYRAKFPADLRRHMSQSHRNQLQAVGRFACTHCERSYKYRSDLYVHMRKSHRIDTSKLKPIMAVPNSPSKVVQEDPMKTTPDPSTTRSPRMKHTPMRPAPGKAPSSKGKTPDSVDKQKHRCLYCDYVGSCKSEIDRHTLTHTGQKPFQCLFCDYKTIWKGDMKRHLQKHHTQEVEKGDLISLLEKTYKPAEIPEGSIETSYETFLENTSFTLENTSGTGDQEDFEPPKEVTQPYTMEQLYGPSVFEAGIYEAGTVVVIPEAPEDTKAVSQDSFDAELKKYPELGDNPEYIDMEHDDFKKAITPMKETFDRRSVSPSPSNSTSSSITQSLEGSTKSDSFVIEPTEDGKRIVYCPRCPFTCDAVSKMKNHILVHDNVKKFKCAYCGKRSNWLWDVRKHIKATHHGKDPKNVITMSFEEAKETLDEYLKNFRPKSGKSVVSSTRLNDSPSQVMPSSIYYSSGMTPAEHNSSREESPKIEDPMGFPMNYKKIPAELRVKPFKCGVCGKRSNWKHDLIKHIRSHHKGKGEIVTMTLKEARDTLDENDVSPEKTSNGTPSNKPGGAAKQISTWVKPSPDGVSRCGGIKRFKCSDCPYRSDYSGDVTRHVPRRHPSNPKAALVVLSVEEAAETIDQYEYNWAKNRAKRGRVGAKVFSPARGKRFKCSKCQFRAENKAIVVEHLRSEHGASSKAAMYKCKLCNFFSMHVESVKTHLRETHRSVDNSLIVKQLTDDVGHVDQIKPARSSLFKVRVNARGGRYKCGLCSFLSPWKHSAERHIKNKHKETTIENALIILDSGNPSQKSKTIKSGSSERTAGMHNCHICPYQTRKKNLYRLHLTRHKKSAGNPYSCKYCTFYTCNTRLLNQHVQLHLNDPRGPWSCKQNNASLDPAARNTNKVANHVSYYCDKCPYIGKILSDYLYHKQFHRPRANAPFKCEKCPYWASVKRLISQHKKVHDPDYQDRLKSVGRYPTGQNITLLNGSPAKTDVSEDSYCVYDPVQMANLKQSIIMSKVKGVPIPNSSLLPHQVPMTPGTAMRGNQDPNLMYGAVVSKTGVVMNSSMYRKMHKCKHCPYANAKESKVKLHEKMHGPRKNGKETFKCTYCDYTAGNKGVLTHHIKVHSKQYNPYRNEINDVEGQSDENKSDDGDNITPDSKMTTPQKTPVKLDPSRIPSDTGFYIKFDEKTGEHRLESIRMKKWCCERCPYATAKQSQFERHVKLHNSKQKYTCEYCDYSVPRYNLLLQHKSLHLYPNHNLLVTQSVTNLMKLPEVDADVAAAANFPVEKNKEQENSVHDHLELYENTESFMEPKKLYRCDRCPYANVQRSHLLAHLRCHMIKNSLQCPHCDYSVPKQHLLLQHIKIHFTGMESDNTAKSDDTDTEEELAVPLEDDTDMIDNPEETSDGVKLDVEACKTEKSGDSKKENDEPMDTDDIPEQLKHKENDVENVRKSGDNNEKQMETENMETKKLETGEAEDKPVDKTMEVGTGETSKTADTEAEQKSVTSDGATSTKSELNNNDIPDGEDTLWICQYCDRAFGASEKLLQHEMQHLVGNTV